MRVLCSLPQQFVADSVTGVNCCQLYQRANEERAIHRHFLKEQYVRVGIPSSWRVQGQSYGASRSIERI